MSTHPFVNTAIRAARAAGKIIMQSFDQRDRVVVESKGLHDFVSNVDRSAEKSIIQLVQKTYPTHDILGEESGLISKAGEFTWVIDPLDGTTNFLHGLPQFAVSIGIMRQDAIEHGVIYDPFKDELFYASAGGGAFLNQRRIRISSQNRLDDALLGTGFVYKEDQMAHLRAYLEMFATLTPQVAGIRRAGAAALDLAYVAAGRLDGFWEFGLGPWDMAAGALLIKEAGGIVTDFRGNGNYMQYGHLVAGTPRVHMALQALTQQHFPTF